MAEHWIVEAVPSDDPDEQEAARLWNTLGADALDVMTEDQADALLRIWERDATESPAAPKEKPRSR